MNEGKKLAHTVADSSLGHGRIFVRRASDKSHQPHCSGIYLSTGGRLIVGSAQWENGKLQAQSPVHVMLHAF